MGAHVVAATPEGKWAPSADAIATAQKIAAKSGATVEVTHDANARFNAGKSDMNVIAKDAAMDLAGTKNQMDGFEFPDAATTTMPSAIKFLIAVSIVVAETSKPMLMFTTARSPS